MKKVKRKQQNFPSTTTEDGKYPGESGTKVPAISQRPLCIEWGCLLCDIGSCIKKMANPESASNRYFEYMFALSAKL